MMDNFFSWEFLTTFAGATSATTIITQFTKSAVEKYAKIPAQLWSYLVSLSVILLSMIFTGNFSISNMVLSIFNAILITLSANGAYKILKNNSETRMDSK